MEKSETLLLKPGRAAVLLDMSRSKVYDAVARGELPSVRIAGQLRIPLAEVKKLIAERLQSEDNG